MCNDAEPMGKKEATKFRGLAARANYIVQDRMDVQCAAKDMCKEMSAPVPSPWGRLKRLARYLLEYPEATWRFPVLGKFEADNVHAYSDSDWAGCKVTRKIHVRGFAVG